MKPDSRNLWGALLLSVALLALPGCGMMAPSGAEGYADLQSLGARDTDITITLSLGPTLLRFAANHIEDDPEMAELLAALDGVRIRIYDVDGDAGRVAERIAGMSSALQASEWEPIVQVREGDEVTQVLVKSREDTIKGLIVLTSDTQEAVVVNVMGELDPAFFSRAMAALEVELANEHLQDLDSV
jgi:hypothetical protein